MTSGWKLIHNNPMLGVRTFMIEDEHHIILKEEHYISDALLASNKERYNDSIGKKWGDGQIAASIPQGLWFANLAEARTNKDEKYIKRWLNDSDNRAFRTFHGKV